MLGTLGPSCPICMEEIVHNSVSVDGCAHVTCSVCFLARLATGMGELDLIDPLLCPLCKTGSYFARPGANNDDTAMKEVHDMHQLLWRQCQDEEDGPAPPMPAPQGMLPLVVYATYARNAAAIALGRKIPDKRKRDQYMSSAICPLGDTANTKRRRKSACVALARIHRSIEHRRREGHRALEEAQDLVAALEDDAREDPARRVSMFIVVVLLAVSTTEKRTAVYMRHSAGQALAEALRATTNPDMRGLSIIRCDDQGEEVPVSEVLVVVPFSDSSRSAGAVSAIVRQMRQPQCDRMCAAEADALVAAMAEGLEGISVHAPPSGGA